MLLALLAIPLPGQPLSQSDRNFAMSDLHATRKRFLDAVAGLSQAQWEFKPAPDRWSIAECAEHLAISEDVVFDRVRQMLGSPAQPARKAEVKDKDKDRVVLDKFPDRSSKREAPESLLPRRRWAKPEEAVAHFRASRDRNIAYVEKTQDELRSHFAENRVLGLIDAFQQVLIISAHTERHVRQIEELKADPKFPRQ